MTKYCNSIWLITTIFIIGCESNPNKLVTKSNVVLDGWEISKTIYDFEINPRDMFFINSETGFVVGFNGKIFKTTDSGESWQEQISGTTLHLYSVYFLNENIGFVAGKAMSGCLDEDCDKGSVLLKTTNGGKIWSKLFFEDYTRINCMKFFDESKGLAIIHTPDVPNSRDYYLARTNDSGENWKLIDLDIKLTYDKYFFVDDVVFNAGENQKIFKSDDFGNNWETIDTPIDAWNDVRNIYFYDENIGFVDGVTNIYKTTDGGLNWETTNFPFSSFGVFHFYSANEGINIGTVSVYEGGEFPTFKGSICYQTLNGGDNWEKSDLIDSLNLGLTYFPQKDLGYGINGSEFYTIMKKN